MSIFAIGKTWRRLHQIAIRFAFFLFVFTSLRCATTVRIPNLAEITPRDIQRKTERTFKNLHSFQGKARVILEKPGKGYRGFASIYMNLPDSVYVKTEAILGIDIGALFLDSRFFAAYAPRDNILYYGEVESLDLRDFLEVDISTDELFEVFSGLEQIVINAASSLTFSEGTYIIKTPLDETSITYHVDARKYVVTRSELTNSLGEPLLLKEYKRIRKKRGLQLPQIIKLTRPKAKERITVFYTSQRINKEIDKRQFKIKPAKNARRVYWGDVRRPAAEDHKGNDNSH
ncbi:MAG: DUF4292 domain-containing protein [bacterium]